MKKRIGYLLMALALWAGLAIPAAAAETNPSAHGGETVNPFTDVAETDDFYQPVLWAAEEGITAGTTETTFSPEDACTRAQAAVLLWRAAGSPEPRLTESQYVDVEDPAAYYYKAVQWAAQMDMEGSGTFWPDDGCTRIEAAYFLWRAAGSPAAKTEAVFADMDLVGDDNMQFLYDPAAIHWAVETGVVPGTSETTFTPNAVCTRGQFVTFLYQAFASQARPAA